MNKKVSIKIILWEDLNKRGRCGASIDMKASKLFVLLEY